MKLWAYCNGAKNKKECAEFTRPIPYNEWDIPVNKNGAIITGSYPNSQCLVVIDFDHDINKPINTAEIDKLLPDTLSVETGTKGLHYYFWIVDEVINNKAFNELWLTDEAIGFGLKEIDIRGEGGIIFAPGCTFKDHRFYICKNCGYKIQETKFKAISKKNEGLCPNCEEPLTDMTIEQGTYKILKNNPIFVCEYRHLLGILSIFILDAKKDKPRSKKKQTLSSSTISVVPVNYKYKKMRKGFVDIISGEFVIEHGTQQVSGEPEHLYWSSFWREFLNCGGTVDEGIDLFNKNKNQPEFDEKTTRYQINQILSRDKRPSKFLYYKLFPMYFPKNIIQQMQEDIYGVNKDEKL